MSMTYYSSYSIEDCIGLISRKNIYDVFDYEFNMKSEEAGEIVFIQCNNHYWHGDRSVYKIEFKRSHNTIININFIKEGLFLPFSTISPAWIDEFMKQKFDAVNDMETHNDE